MGLGKTVEAIAAAEIVLHELGTSRMLVICPASLKHQWHEEIRRLTGRDARAMAGSQRQRATHFAAPGVYKSTNHDTLWRDRDLIDGWAPHLVIADEAQRIENWDTPAARCLKLLRNPYAFVLTGTPLENRLQELLSVVQFIDEHRLGPTWRFLDRHQIVSESGRVTGYRCLDEIGDALAPTMIRRHRAEVLNELPPRIEKNYVIPLTQVQRSLHEESAELVARIAARWRRQRYLSDADRKRLMAALQTMRMACNSS